MVPYGRLVIGLSYACISDGWNASYVSESVSLCIS